MVDRFNPNRIILSTNKHNMSCSNTAAEILSVYKNIVVEAKKAEAQS